MKTMHIAKIARPKLSAIVKRDRLFNQLDQARQKPVVWIEAQAGSGKTTLVADWLESRKLPCLWYQIDEGDADIASFFYYMGMAAKIVAPRYKKSLPLMTPEYLQGIPVFTRRYFEELFRRLAATSVKGSDAGFVIVLDNYQDAPPTSGFHDMMAHGLDAIPEGITFVILSRAAPPPQLARLQANNRLHVIGWDDVRFTREESLGLLETRVHGKATPEALAMLHDKTEGWAAGLILLAGAGMEASITSSPANLTPDKLFDYFANEIFNKTDSSLQDVLLKTSFLQKIDSVMAEKLTGNAMAGQILERMSRDHYFTQKYGQVYQYQPLFREFLRSRAQTNFSSADIVALQRKAAELLEQSGSGEEAVELFLDATDWDGAERMVLNQAPALVSQGRSHTLEGWLHRLPPEYLNNSPWSLYWFGICRIAYNPAEARGYLEKAFPHFKKEKNVPGVFLAWAAIIDTIIYEWSDFRPLDHWIKEAEDLITEYPGFPSPEIEARVVGGMLSALAWWQSGHPDLPRWAEKAKLIVLHHPSIELRVMLGNNLLLHYFFSGAFAQASLLMEVLKPLSNSKESTPLTHQYWFIVEVMYAGLLKVDNKACVQAVTKGLKHAQEHGIHLLDFQLLGMAVYSGITQGDPEFARMCLEKMAEINSPRTIDQAFFHYQTASLAWCLGDLKKSIEHGKLALQIIEPTGCNMPFSISLMETSLTLFDDGQHEEAKRYLAKHDELAHTTPFITYTRLLYGARFAFELGEEEQGLALLKQGLTIGSRQGYVNMYRWHDRTMARLCARALEHNIETAYVLKLIRTRHLVPEDSVEHWPYPIKLYTLGRFSIELDGKPMRFVGKVQKKPLELLMALVSFGGREVSEAHLCEALWEGAEADAAHTACAMALHRLRKLLGDEDAVLLSDNRVSLNPAKFWVDAWLFERVVAQAGSGTPSAIEVQRVLNLYQGTFLGEAASAPWALAAREKLRAKFLRFAVQASSCCLHEGRHEQAMRLIDLGLEAEPLAEELYRSRMRCEAGSGRRAEALATYLRCERMLATVLGIEPSDETRLLYQALRENRPLP